MSTINSFGVHFILRMNKAKNGSAPIYARISVNGERVEMSLRKNIRVIDWNNSKALARPKNEILKLLNNHLEHVRCFLTSHYLRASLTDLQIKRAAKRFNVLTQFVVHTLIDGFPICISSF